MKALFIDVYREETIINEINVDTGECRRLKKVCGNFKDQSEQIFLLIMKRRPEKVLMDDSGIGKGLLDQLIGTMREHGLNLLNDKNVIYGVEEVVGRVDV
ncbi:hypothetical protein MOD25_06005 [Bacillus haynesii]|uniref:hypothetical protein n=1 Tax=Bacillus haynesii TaxID=1925021 RepID=UPI00228274E4|nr:hypothetical protein [Bacillus haynesii]MCY8549457.1 hypothetical protein [Bacillus haynesii]